MHFAERLRAERSGRHLSQEALAAALGVSPRSVARWEQGQTIPHTSIRMQLSRFFDLPLTELFGDPEEISSLPPVWSVPYPRNPFFTGRDEFLTHLHEQLSRVYTPDLTQSWAISGLGGAGKTQVALEYAYRYRLEYQAIFWVTAENTETLRTSLQRIADQLQLPERQANEQAQMLNAVQRWLATHHQWLLIADDLEKDDLLEKVVPPMRQGVLLLTTRRQALGVVAEPIVLSPMSSEEGTHLLLRRARQLHLSPPGATTGRKESFPPEAMELVEVLGGLPLALDQAGAYIDETGCSIADYLQRYRTTRQHLLARRGNHGGSHPSSVTTTFLLALKSVEQQQPVAVDLLRMCAFLYPESIPEEMFTAGKLHLGSALGALIADPYQFDIAIATLRSVSLVTRHLESRTLSVHRLEQALLQDHMKPAEIRMWSRRAVCLVNTVFPEGDFSTWVACERYLLHALTCIQLIEQEGADLPEAGELLSKMGSYLLARGRLEEAERLLKYAVRLGEELYGPDHPQTVEIHQEYHRLLEHQHQALENGGTHQQESINAEETSAWTEEASMETISLPCPHCQSETLVRNGHAANGKQLYRCRTCGRQSREHPTPHRHSQARREEILHAYHTNSSLRDLARTFGVSRATISNWLKNTMPNSLS